MFNFTNGLPMGFGSQMLADYFQPEPSRVKGRRNEAVETQMRYLYNMVYSVYDFGLPKGWALNIFRFFLFRMGSVGVVYTHKFGWIFWPYGVTKLDWQYQPAVIEIWNEHLTRAQTGIIGVNAGIVRIMDDYGGLEDLVVEYAEKLAQCDKSVDINLMNANVSLAAYAKSKKDADDIYEAYGEATTGKPMVVINKALAEEPIRTLIDSPKQNFMALEMLQARREIVDEFLTKIGIRTANYDKRAQMSDDEIRQRDGESRALCTIMLENIREGFEALNKISGLGLSVGLREEVTGDGKDDAMGDAADKADAP